MYRTETIALDQEKKDKICVIKGIKIQGCPKKDEDLSNSRIEFKSGQVL